MKFFNFFEITTFKCQFLNEYMTGMDVSTAISTAKKCRPIIDPIGNSDISKDLISNRINLILQSVKILNIIFLNSLVDLFLLVLAIMITVTSLFADYYSLFSLILPFSLLFCLRVYLSLPLILFFFFSSHLSFSYITVFIC